MNAELHLRFRMRDGTMRQLLDRYVDRAGVYRSTRVVEHTPAAVVAAPAPRVWRVLCASDGELWSTDALVAAWRRQEAAGRTVAELLIGAADGWPGAAAHTRLAFGRITMPHQLAAVVLAEQVYRVFTVLAGHPYHLAHEAVA